MVNIMKTSKLAYICNPEQVQKLHEENTQHGVFYFIRKVGEQRYHAYRKVETGADKFYYVQTSLSIGLFQALIASGKINKVMN